MAERIRAWVSASEGVDRGCYTGELVGDVATLDINGSARCFHVSRMSCWEVVPGMSLEWAPVTGPTRDEIPHDGLAGEDAGALAPVALADKPKRRGRRKKR